MLFQNTTRPFRKHFVLCSVLVNNSKTPSSSDCIIYSTAAKVLSVTFNFYDDRSALMPALLPFAHFSICISTGGHKQPAYPLTFKYYYLYLQCIKKCDIDSRKSILCFSMRSFLTKSQVSSSAFLGTIYIECREGKTG